MFEPQKSLEYLYSEITDNVRISVLPIYVPSESNYENNIYVWSYNIRIENLRQDTIQILGRHWFIYDQNGNITEVNGSGVVGFQPILQCKEVFKYSSEVRLFTKSGIMLGNFYGVKMNDNQKLIVKIPPFSLDINERNSLAN